MKTLPDILLELLLAAMILFLTATISYPEPEETAWPEIETDLTTDCQEFPCYTAKHMVLWVSRKYLTMRKP